MVCTPEERAAISRRNGRKSRGPTTAAGKRSAAMNSLVHGMAARVLVLPAEDREQVEAQYRGWIDVYRPRSPGAMHLLNMCFQATLQSERCRRSQFSALASL